MKNETTQKTTVVYHSADFDGQFCREIARKFLPDAELIGWDFGDAPLKLSGLGENLYVLDLPMDRPFGIHETRSGWIDWPVGDTQVVWIDHHKSSIETHNPLIPGYRIDGVAACRLAWQWFLVNEHNAQAAANRSLQVVLPNKEAFVERRVPEPLGVRLAGEYDIWDKRDPRAELFQHGLRSRDLGSIWPLLLERSGRLEAEERINDLLLSGECIAYARANEYREVITEQGFDVEFEGLTFLACNSHECDIRSQLFEAGIKPHHDGLLGFTFGGNDWRVSLYQVPGKPEHDMSAIAAKHGGGGHRGASGFRAKWLPFLKIPFLD